MAELIIRGEPIEYEAIVFERWDIIKAYRNGYYRKWKGKLMDDVFVLRLPLIRTREIKRLFIHGDEHVRRLFRVSNRVNPKGKPCVTRWCINSAKWIRCK